MSIQKKAVVPLYWNTFSIAAMVRKAAKPVRKAMIAKIRRFPRFSLTPLKIEEGLGFRILN
jgi:hypothetical protein